MDIAGYHLPPAQGRAWSRLVNESLAESLGALPATFWGLATVPLQDPPAAAAELRHAVLTLGFRGAMIDTHVEGRALAEPALDPFWRAAMELSVPVILHPFVLEQVERFGAYYLHNLVGYPFETTLAAAGLIFAGTLTHSARSLCFLCDVVGADRLLLGSDFPFGLGDPEPVAAVRRAGLGEANERAALGENAMRLFQLTPEAR